MPHVNTPCMARRPCRHVRAPLPSPLAVRGPRTIKHHPAVTSAPSAVPRGSRATLPDRCAPPVASRSAVRSGGRPGLPPWNAVGHGSRYPTSRHTAVSLCSVSQRPCQPRPPPPSSFCFEPSRRPRSGGQTCTSREPTRERAAQAARMGASRSPSSTRGRRSRLQHPRRPILLFHPHEYALVAHAKRRVDHPARAGGRAPPGAGARRWPRTRRGRGGWGRRRRCRRGGWRGRRGAGTGRSGRCRSGPWRRGRRW